MAAKKNSNNPVFVHHPQIGGIEAIVSIRGSLSRISIPGKSKSNQIYPTVNLPNAFVEYIEDPETLISDSGKMAALDALLNRLKDQGHRVLIYSQMTRMIDILEELMRFRRHKYMRLDGSSKISERRDMVADFQSK